MRLIYVNSSKVTKLEQKMNNSESFLLLLKNLLKCTYEVLLPSQRIAKRKAGGVDVSLILSLWVPAVYLRVSDNITNIYDRNT